MTDPQAPETTQSAEISQSAETTPADLVEDSLVEEISIDGMCGVY